MKRICLIFLCISLLMMTAACGQENAVTGGGDKGVFVVNQYRFGDCGDIPIPDGTELEDDGDSDAPRYRVGVMADLDAYYRAAEQQGFTTEELPYFTLLYREGCYLFLSHYGDDDFEGDVYGYLRVYCGVDTPSGGLSTEQARVIINPDSRLTPIDVSPEGLFEHTGGQIFMLPVYSIDYWKEYYGKDGYDGADVPENRRYYEKYYYVCGCMAIRLDMPDLAFADLDGDGEREMLRMGFGPTSGVFSLTLTAYRRGEKIADGLFVPVDYLSLHFKETDGEVRLADEAGRSLAIILDGGRIRLTENGEPFDEWGSFEEQDEVSQNP